MDTWRSLDDDFGKFTTKENHEVVVLKIKSDEKLKYVVLRVVVLALATCFSTLLRR